MTEPVTYSIRCDLLVKCKDAIASGIDYARECLADHDLKLGRTTYKNKTWAEHIEMDIKQMQDALANLPEIIYDHTN